MIWIVDPIAHKVTVLEWVDGLYEDQIYQGEQPIVSPQLADFKLSAATVLTAGR
jgi:Uma2 family endonuclease